MGYNTAAIILNDGLDQFTKSSDIGQRIHDGVSAARNTPQPGPQKSTTVPVGNHANPMAVMSSCHADETQIILIGGNMIRRPMRYYGQIPYWKFDDPTEGSRRPMTDEETSVELLKIMAHQLGYSVRKK